MRSSLPPIHIENCFGSVIDRAAIHIQNHDSIADKILLVTIFYGLHRLHNRARVVVRRYGNEQIDFAHTHELAKEVVSEKDVVRQVKVRSPISSCLPTRQVQKSLLTEEKSSNPAKSEPEKLIGRQRQQIRQIADSRKQVPAKHLDGNVAFITLKIE